MSFKKLAQADDKKGEREKKGRVCKSSNNDRQMRALAYAAERKKERKEERKKGSTSARVRAGRKFCACVARGANTKKNKDKG